ncbi:tyrosine-type recombinase/integrase [Candidatus Bipolaricaulota bacterium]|nr:tyrosine-type recombinase/integrase [Candidatus Bipolaricaulota bacterium]
MLDEEEVDQLLETAKGYTNKWTGIRDYTMVLLLLDAGLRATEILEAKKENLNLERRSLKIHGKGAKDRKVFFGTQARKWLKQWLQVREDISNPVVENILFVDLNGNQIKQRNLTRIINRLQKRADLPVVQATLLNMSYSVNCK